MVHSGRLTPKEKTTNDHGKQGARDTTGACGKNPRGRSAVDGIQDSSTARHSQFGDDGDKRTSETENVARSKSESGIRPAAQALVDEAVVSLAFHGARLHSARLLQS